MKISWRRIWITSAVLAGLTLVLGFTELWQLSIREYARGATEFSWVETAFFVYPSWIVLAFLTPLILLLAERFPLEGRRFRWNIAAHILAGFAFAVIHLSIASWVSTVGLPRLRLSSLLGSVLGTYLVYDLLNYWLIIGLALAIQYYRRYRERELDAAQLQRSLTEAKLLALRGQLNPHFLYNTLNSISTMALKGDQHGVVQTLAKLSDLLRATLDEGLEQEVPLRKELELTDLYLHIQQIRFGDRLQVERSIEPSLMDMLVPAMMLQPLVENAVIHGLSARPGEGIIRISAARVDSTLQLQVRDTGPGFGAKSRGGNGIGLANTRARLEQMYGQAHRLECGNAPDGGAAVTITIPLRTRSESWSDDPDADRRRRAAGS